MTCVIQQFERNLRCYIEGCSFGDAFGYPLFEKKNTDNPFGDFSAHLSNKSSKREIKTHSSLDNVFHEIKGLELHSRSESWPLIVDSIKLDCNRLILKLNREHANRTGLELVNRTTTEYGTNKEFINKVFLIKQENAIKNDLTHLRTQLMTKLTTNLIKAGGGSILDENNPNLEGVELLKVGRKCFGHNAITVGAAKIMNNISGDAILSAEDYRKLRENDVSELNEHKEQNNKEAVQQLVNAAICFDMLSTKVDRPVTLDVSAGPMMVREHSSKGSTFVLYNYARICAILNQFDDRVTQQVCGPLLPIVETSTELLAQKEEWSLMFDFILEWPQTVRSCQNLSSLKLHNVCSFLSSLSLCFSAFYRRCRVLTDPLPHLLPLMYARIHLLLALKQVYKNAFTLLSIEAPTYM